MLTHFIYLTIIAGLVVWVFRLEARRRHWYSEWHSLRNRFPDGD